MINTRKIIFPVEEVFFFFATTGSEINELENR